MTTSPPRVNFLLRQPRQVQGFRELLHPSEAAESPESTAQGRWDEARYDEDLLDRGPASAPATGEEPPALTLLWIPPGRFWMGSPATEVDRSETEGPQHLVQLQGFFMGQTPITQAQWRQVALWQPLEGERWGRELKPNPSWFQSGEAEGQVQLLAGESSTANRPVEQVSWHDAMEFCNRLSQRTGRTYRLPSEAQWEYACRAGTSTPFHFGETITTAIANYNGTSTYANGPKGEDRKQTTPVGMFPANAWGLQDMHGNVWEWCLDHWHRSYEGAPVDGSAWLKEPGVNDQDDAKTRLLRGGSWINNPGLCRSSCRDRPLPDFANYYAGFRVVCLPQGPSLNP
jgi:formylglycine-generating enzyme required for sulfatase activity